MNNFISQPYKLYNKIQNYDWGTKNEDAFIPKFLGIEAEPDVPYGELWIGAHPKASSEIELNGRRITLAEAIRRFPKELLGSYVIEKFNGQFPFLLKVLSSARALSIQLHPNKEQAERLHSKDPKNYPDDNHKPEIAIAVDLLTAVAGFKPVDKIIRAVSELPELILLVGKEAVTNILSAQVQTEKEIKIKELYSAIMKSSSDEKKLSACITGIADRLSGKSVPSEGESQFLIQHKLYGNDVGLLSFFFFNMVHLKPNQAIFTDAGIPHAYIRGNIIECMANSDNVVRAGLTNKFKDVETLLEIVRYDFSEYGVLNSAAAKDEVVFKTSAREFQISMFEKAKGFTKEETGNNKPVVYLVEHGEIEISWKDSGEEKILNFAKGESFLIPAELHGFKIKTKSNTKFYVVNVPASI